MRLTVLAATTQQQLGLAVVVALLVGWAIYLVAQLKGGEEKPGSEIEFAPNRRPYFDDEEMEGKRLDGTLTWSLVLLVIVAVGLPLYWLNEPGRQAGAIKKFDDQAAGRGFQLFQNANAPGGHNVGHFGCADCHGSKGQGGSTPYNLTDPAKPDAPPRKVTWLAPALDTVLLRFSPEEVNRIITYGRPNTPMPAWGVQGGGPMNVQQVLDLVAYLESIKLTPEQARKRVAKLGTDGAALFDAMCSRCHTKGWSYGEPDETGGGAFGPSLLDGVTTRQFPTLAQHLEFVTVGSDFEKPYGTRGVGSGRMPGFGLMLTKAQIRAIAEYERSL
ncbi:MAG TPA: c-type cytochrome [Acidimicrobiales bacterium]|nr:c-type cytochrome [Acidimicrobiales bacterium]